MKSDKAPAIACLIVLGIIFWAASKAGGATEEFPLHYGGGDYDHVRTLVYKHQAPDWNLIDSLIIQSAQFPLDTFASLDNSRDHLLVDWYTNTSCTDSVPIARLIKYEAGAATISSTDKKEIAHFAEETLKVHHGTGSYLTGGAGSGIYTVDVYAFDTLGGTTTAVEGATVDFRLWGLGQPSHRTVNTWPSGAGRIATNVGSLAVRIVDNPFYIFPTAWDSLSWTADYSDSIYGYLNVPAAATSPNYVRAYVDIGEGIIDSASGSMIPRNAVQLHLELIGHPTLNDGSWMIIPKRYTATPSTSGRVNFVIPANTVLTPEGSYYVLSFRAYDGTQKMSGELKRFIVDTIPDPLLILDAMETW